jgi:hypothetical protein
MKNVQAEDVEMQFKLLHKENRFLEPMLLLTKEQKVQKLLSMAEGEIFLEEKETTDLSELFKK